MLSFLENRHVNNPCMYKLSSTVSFACLVLSGERLKTSVLLCYTRKRFDYVHDRPILAARTSFNRTSWYPVYKGKTELSNDPTGTLIRERLRLVKLNRTLMNVGGETMPASSPLNNLYWRRQVRIAAESLSKPARLFKTMITSSNGRRDARG